MPSVAVAMILLAIPLVSDAALEKKVPCWPGFDFTVAPPYGDPQCQFNEANDCGFPPPPLSVQPTKQDADKYTEIVQNDTRSQVTGEVQRSGWQGSGQGSPSPCQASTKSTYNVQRVKQNQAAGKCVVSEKNCKVTIIDSAPKGGDAPKGGRVPLSTDLETARRTLLKELEASVARPDLHGDALFAAQALNYLGYTGDTAKIFADAEARTAAELDAAASLAGIAGQSVRDARTEAAALAARLDAIAALRQIAFSPVGLSSANAGSSYGIGTSYGGAAPAQEWSQFGRFAPGTGPVDALLRTFSGDSMRPVLGGAQQPPSLWQRFRAWAASFFRW